MFHGALSTLKKESGFNMIELMVVVIIVGLLSAVAVPIYMKYARNARITEATSRIGDLLTAAKTYAVENEGNGNPNATVWPANCDVDGFIGNCSETKNFMYELSGPNGTLKITAEGRQSTPAQGLNVTVEISNPMEKPTMTVTGF